ncbi:hypothetical protein N7510_006447 [Penicillium lagena]|uniref:uncharacterized protein n=1 Tax=Penicillium lagena TaxID=94218 RepID=UPI002540A423|nr:uncharacterized protein N7510_006447 [Penicillium lagena]KAJ5613253.1 hypothetical protein N7510_006447 [Penicillium lagena]
MFHLGSATNLKAWWCSKAAWNWPARHEPLIGETPKAPEFVASPLKHVRHRRRGLFHAGMGHAKKCSLESGHANHLRDDRNTTAYWYQTLPGPRLDSLPVEKGIPRRPQFPSSADVPELEVSSMSVEKQAMVWQQGEHMEVFVKDRNEWLWRRAQVSQERARSYVRDLQRYPAAFSVGVGQLGQAMQVLEI